MQCTEAQMEKSWISELVAGVPAKGELEKVRKRIRNTEFQKLESIATMKRCRASSRKRKLTDTRP
jgi:hypothetical protein